jgi:hypothetical protein
MLVTVIRNIKLSLLTLLLLSQSTCFSTTLHFSQSSDRPLALYRAPAPYQEAGKARLNSIIITSKPFSIGNQQNITTTQPNINPQWRRELLVTSSNPSTASSATIHPRLSPHIPHYSIDCTNEKSCSETISINSTASPTFKPYSQDVLEKFLNDYAGYKLNTTKQLSKNETATYFVKLSNSHNRNFTDSRSKGLTAVEPSVEATNRLANLYLDDEDERDSVSIDGKSKAHWSLINAQHHNHPYDDRDGWVSLEAVPWSSSKISKWQSSNTGNKRPQWDNRPPTQEWNSDRPSNPWERPQYSDRPTDWNHDKPLKPQFLVNNRPADDTWSQEADHKPLLHLERPVGDYSYKPTYGHHQQWITSNHPDIITEGTPENWPISINRPAGAGSFKPWPSQETDYTHSQHQYDDSNKYEPNRRPPTPVVYHDGGRPQNYPESGEGEWVLLSSTKGYSLPIRHHSYQRALTLNPKPITSTRAVKLTVLPPLNGTANITTSHGGLLEVESTFQSVDEAQRDDALKRTKNDTKLVPLRLVSTPLKKKGSGSAVLAAVGAGMLPATMALLVPMMLGRKKRSTRAPNVKETITTPPVQGYVLSKVNNRNEDEGK